MSGWMGSRRELLDALAAAGADRDPDGNFQIFGAPIVVGLDPDEVVVPPGALYALDGRHHGLAELLAGRGHGMAVTVIG